MLFSEFASASKQTFRDIFQLLSVIDCNLNYFPLKGPYGDMTINMLEFYCCYCCCYYFYKIVLIRLTLYYSIIKYNYENVKIFDYVC